MRTIYRYKLLFLLIVPWLSTMTVVAQESPRVNVVDSVEALNALCPMSFSDDWGINSITMVGNSYSLVDVGMPANLSMVLPMLTNDSDRVKQMWIKQLDSSFGEHWKRFVELMVENDSRIVVNFRPKGSEETALITFSPTDFVK